MKKIAILILMFAGLLILGCTERASGDKSN